MPSSNLQAIVISKNHYSKRAAENWIKLHGFTPVKKCHVTINTYRFRLKPPNENKYDYRMKQLTTGIKAVIQYPKNNLDYYY